MNDPHVVALHYELTFGTDVAYQPPQSPIAYQHPSFDIELDGAHVRFIPKAHFGDKEAARAACDPVVRAWEVLIALEVGSLDSHLRYQKTEIIDRNPTPGVIELHVESIASATSFGIATLVRSLNHYPHAPDPAFHLSPDAEFLWHRYRMFKQGREPLLSMAYFVLTAVEAPAGGRKAAATAFNVDENILRKIGELSSTRGDKLSARKHAITVVPLGSDKAAWLQRAVEKLIVQVGRSHAGRPPQALTFADLPTL